MATNQNLTWMMNRNWQVVSAVPVNNSLTNSIVMTDTLKFTSLGTIESTHNFSSGSQSLPQTWGTWDPNSVTANSLKGTMISSGTPFHIDYVTGQLQCFLDPSQSRRRRWEVAWAVLGGTLAGVAVGVAARAPFVGFLAGFVAAGTSAAVASQGADSVQGGPNATWVANDGGSGVPQHRPHEVPHEMPRTLKAVSA
jgi:hypothetical protein